MTDLDKLFAVIDQLPRTELERLDRYIQRRRSTTVWAVPSESIKEIEELLRPTHELAASMDDEEINAVLDEALAEVRRERKTQSRI